MGRLTEALDTVQNGFSEIDSYSYLNMKDKDTRVMMAIMRRESKKQPKTDNDTILLF